MNEVASSAVEWSEIWIITGVGYTVVFLALLLLVFLFQSMPKVLGLHLGTRIKDARKKMTAKEESTKDKEYLSGEVSAAIGMALSLYFKEQHDEESGILTIKRVARTYSPWSSKIYGVHNTPR